MATLIGVICIKNNNNNNNHQLGFVISKWV